MPDKSFPWWDSIALAVVIVLVIYLFIEIYTCRKRLDSPRERFSEQDTAKQAPLASNACVALLKPLETQGVQHQKYRSRFLTVSSDTHPDLEHTKYDYCYVRDFDHNAAPDYSPVCDKKLNELYSNEMIKRVFSSEVRDQDSQLNIPRKVCMMELERDRINANNMGGFLRDLNAIENAEFMKDLNQYKTELALLHKNNAELAANVVTVNTRLSETQEVANKEATVAKHAQIDLRLAQLQQESDKQNKVIIIDGDGSVIYESNAPMTFDMSSFKGQVRSIVLPSQGSFRVITTSPKGEFTYTSTELNLGQAGIQVQKVRVA